MLMKSTNSKLIVNKNGMEEKKFWKSIEVIKIKAEFGILLDKNLLKTPQKKKKIFNFK